MNSSGFKWVQIGGELSQYMFDEISGRVWQVKTRRTTGQKFRTEITGTKKAEKVKEEAGRQ